MSQGSMKQVFPPGADTVLRAVAAVAALALGGSAVVGAVLMQSDYVTSVTLPPAQPVPFSHRHHAGELGIDCRYCHVTAETGPRAGLPATQVCMTCHSQLYTGQPMLAPVRDSLAHDRPIPWRTVAQLPQFVTFDHSIHLAKGVGCSSCHGPVDRMPATYRAKAFTMEGFCLSCHRDPGPSLRPLDAITDMDWQPEADPGIARKPMAERRIDLGLLTDCSTCHR
jgi:hypothetical protein